MPAVPIPFHLAAMGCKRFDFVWDYAGEGFNLAVTCARPSCRHSRVIDAQRLAALAMINCWNPGVGQLVDRLVCARCGSRAKTWKGSTEQPDTGPQPGPATEREYREMIRRRRG